MGPSSADAFELSAKQLILAQLNGLESTRRADRASQALLDAELKRHYGGDYRPPGDDMIMVESPTTITNHYHGEPPGPKPPSPPCPPSPPATVRQPAWRRWALLALAAAGLLGAGAAVPILVNQVWATGGSGQSSAGPVAPMLPGHGDAYKLDFW